MQRCKITIRIAGDRSVYKKLKRSDIVFIIFGIIAAALLIRAFYGFCQSDESFYVSTAGRFAAGDLVFADEWHPTQLAALITMPVYKVYTNSKKEKAVSEDAYKELPAVSSLTVDDLDTYEFEFSQIDESYKLTSFKKVEK